MEAKFGMRSFHNWRMASTAVLLLALLGGCASSPKAKRPVGPHHQLPNPQPQSTTTPPPEVMGPPEPVSGNYGPEPLTEANPLPSVLPSAIPVEKAISYGPEPVLVRPVTLILGPGLARGFAFVGALRALADSKIPIGAILGTEMGALVGSIYALDLNANHLDWEMQKFKETVFLSEKDLIPTHRFDRELEKIVGPKEIQQTKIPLRIGIEFKKSRSWQLASQGPLREAVRAAMGTSELFSNSNWLGGEAHSSGRSHPYPVAEARKLANGPVVIIDLLDAKDQARYPETHDADLVIRPDMHGIGNLDFTKKTEASFRGKKAIQDKITELKRWVGMPQGEP